MSGVPGWKRQLNQYYLAIRTGLPLSRDSSSASICWSRSIKSASLLISRARSTPVTFFPHVVLNALRAAATAMSISFSDAINTQRELFGLFVCLIYVN